MKTPNPPYAFDSPENQLALDRVNLATHRLLQLVVPMRISQIKTEISEIMKNPKPFNRARRIQLLNELDETQELIRTDP